MGAVRALAQPLVQRARAGHDLRRVEPGAKRGRRIDRRHCRVFCGVVRLALGVLCAGHSRDYLRDLSHVALARHAAIRRPAPHRRVFARLSRRPKERRRARERAGHARAAGRLHSEESVPVACGRRQLLRLHRALRHARLGTDVSERSEAREPRPGRHRHGDAGIFRDGKHGARRVALR